MNVSTIGIDLAKNVFQVHGVDAHGEVVIVRKLRRAQVIAFFTTSLRVSSAWSVRHGTSLGARAGQLAYRLAAAAVYVKAYATTRRTIRRRCGDLRGGDATIDAVRPHQDARAAGRIAASTPDLLIGQRTQLINVLRADLAELGLVAELGRDGLAKPAGIVSNEESAASLPPVMRHALQVVLDQLAALGQQIGQLDRVIAAQHNASDVSRRLESIPGIGMIGATAIAATVTDPSAFKTGRDLAAWIGLVPRQHSTG